MLPPDISDTVARALAEDVGSGDLTAGLIAADTTARAAVIAREDIVLCGQAWFDETFRQVDAGVHIDWKGTEGMRAETNSVVCRLEGPARSLLTGERTALNFLQTLSGTATAARHYVDAVAGLATQVLDTRKTIPGLRNAQKYAARCGGAINHRIGLFDAILIKENHIRAAGSIAAVLAQAAARVPPGAWIEIEVDTLDQLQQALAAGATRILLDNFELDDLRTAVRLTAGRAKLEASGGITLQNIRQIAETGVDFISIGSITKHLRAADFSMEFLP
jgi:nicotinate-nucleotide pyrophosphorylase (carboxylating)